jgi:hypothetical protein
VPEVRPFLVAQSKGLENERKMNILNENNWFLTSNFKSYSHIKLNSINMIFYINDFRYRRQNLSYATAHRVLAAKHEGKGTAWRA